MAVDLEYCNVERKAVILSLMQLSTCDKDYIIDSLVLRSKTIGLKELFTDNRFVKVFHGSDTDL